MDEARWLSCPDPDCLLSWLHNRKPLSERKARLFAAACVRRAWAAVEDVRSRRVIEMTEKYVDGRVTAGEWSRAVYEAGKAARAGMAAGYAALTVASPCAFDAALLTTDPDATYYDPDVGAIYHDPWQAEAANYTFTQAEAWSEGRRAQARLVRDVFGHPFRSLALAPSVLHWNGGLVMRLAQAAYQERKLPDGTLDPNRLAVLADALEEAGCSDAELLEHLHRPGSHVRGCFAVDAVLGKS